jgi:hypothetical protein
MPSSTPPRPPANPWPTIRRRLKGGPGLLLASTAVTGVLYWRPELHWLAWPLMLLSTLAHELGHGLTSILFGGRFVAFYMWPDGSGMAVWEGDLGRLAVAAVAAGGLIGPAVAAAVGFLMGRTIKGSRVYLIALGSCLALIDIIFVRSLFGFVFVGLVVTISLVVGVKGRGRWPQALVILAAVQLALSVFSRGDYLFTATAETAQGPMPSDVAHIAEALFLPFWFWGALCGLVSVAVLGVGMGLLLRR